MWIAIRGLISPNLLSHTCARGSKRGWHTHMGVWALAELSLIPSPPKQEEHPPYCPLPIPRWESATRHCMGRGVPSGLRANIGKRPLVPTPFGVHGPRGLGGVGLGRVKKAIRGRRWAKRV